MLFFSASAVARDLAAVPLHLRRRAGSHPPTERKLAGDPHPHPEPSGHRVEVASQVYVRNRLFDLNGTAVDVVVIVVAVGAAPGASAFSQCDRH